MRPSIIRCGGQWGLVIIIGRPTGHGAMPAGTAPGAVSHVFTVALLLQIKGIRAQIYCDQRTNLLQSAHKFTAIGAKNILPENKRISASAGRKA